MPFGPLSREVRGGPTQIQLGGRVDARELVLSSHGPGDDQFAFIRGGKPADVVVAGLPASGVEGESLVFEVHDPEAGAFPLSLAEGEPSVDIGGTPSRDITSITAFSSCSEAKRS